MESVKNLLEYYEELYPVTDELLEFFKSHISKSSCPFRILSISCGTGALEHRLAKENTDITGLEMDQELLDSATRKQRTQLMSLRYYQMSTLEMTRFLGKGFYNMIMCLNNRLIHIHDKVLFQKFLADCKTLMAPCGTLILELLNYDKYKAGQKTLLPEISSIRVKLNGYLEEGKEPGYAYLTQSLETSTGKKIPVYEKAEVYVPGKNEITGLVKEAGYTKVEFFENFSGKPATEDSDRFIVFIS